jgi:hypothetical protein
MQRSSWLLIIISWRLTGEIHALPLPLATRDVVVLFVTFSYTMQRIFGQTIRRWWGALGALVFINFAWLAVTFLFHPVGVHALGAQTMGGLPYFKVFIALCAYWVIVHLPESYASVVRIPWWLLASSMFSALLSATVYIAPSATPYVWFFYSDVDVSGYMESLQTTGSGTDIHRLGSFGPFGLMVIQFTAAYYLPRKFLNPARWQFYLFALGLVAILVSGFRSSLAFAMGCVALAAWFHHRGWREVVLGGVVGALLLGFLVFGQGRLFDLPLSVQRTLGSLPGQWDEVVQEAVKNSNRRWDWWHEILTEGAIKNWWVGDGFGIGETDYDLIAGGRLNFEEGATLTGALHNGPLTTIRYAGVVGLVLFYALMIAGAVSSVKCVRRCRGTPLQPVAIFLAIDLVWTPIQYTFLFGGFDSQLPEQLFLTGLLTLVWRMSERRPPPTEPAVVARPFSWNNGGTRVSA